MAIFIGAVLAVLSLAVIVYPFFKGRNASERRAPADEAANDGPDLESIYEAIRTLQLDHQLGKVPRGLYQEQLSVYRIQAAQALKQQMETQARDADWALEQEVLMARSSLTQLNGHARSCPNCGAAVGHGLAQCPECNTDLGPVAPEAQEEAET